MRTERTSAEQLGNGTVRAIDGKKCIFYDGYWIRYYDVSQSAFRDKKTLIDQLTKRVFHHTEPGINTPGSRLEEARAAYEQQQEPARKRVNAGMLAGALLNRATDIFTKVVELEEAGIRITPQNELLKECGHYFLEALELGKSVRHYSGEEGLDELWGEPFRAFTLSVEQFYEGRYLKVAQTMSEIDLIRQQIIAIFSPYAGFERLPQLVNAFCDAARAECETLRGDLAIFAVWPEFVATGDELAGFRPASPEKLSAEQRLLRDESVRLIRDGKNLLQWVASARVPMPKSTRDYIALLAAHETEIRQAYPRIRG
ncbi:MAG: hypothetical protein IT494_04570 [Gammaproteobacteria bacterium]|nr:hypothetical protein [Gammaproteobacteria bacterium]